MVVEVSGIPVLWRQTPPNKMDSVLHACWDHHTISMCGVRTSQDADGTKRAVCGRCLRSLRRKKANVRFVH